MLRCAPTRNKRRLHWPDIVPLRPSGGVFTPLHIGAVLVHEGGEREASFGTILADKPCPRPDRLHRPINQVRILPQVCSAATETGLKGGNNARDQHTPDTVEGIEKVHGALGDQ